MTDYDNRNCGFSFSHKEGCQELYLYSAGTNSVKCISCNPTGERPRGNAGLATATLNAHLVPNNLPVGRLTRNLSPDGTRVFFESPDPLLSEDTNSQEECTFRREFERIIPDCMDVYEWEAPGTPGGTCREAEINGGCLYLLSTGKSRDASFFLDASTDGANAFIATTSQLVPTDRDELYDVYDARSGGGISSQQEVAPALCASSDACHGSSSSPPDLLSPGSSSFQGPGNAKQRSNRSTRCEKHGYTHCGKKHHKKRRGKKNAKSSDATSGEAGGSK